MSPENPSHDCPLCPRLVQYRAENRRQYPDWFNGPVPNWGDEAARLIIVGLAPGLKGANRTGRPFTGDYAGDLFFRTLKKVGLATGTYEQRPDDSLRLTGALIVNSVKCVPPQNKPTGSEIATCRQFLSASLSRRTWAAVYVALGRIAHDSLLAALGEKRSAFPFTHGARHRLSCGRLLFDSYHCSRYNTNTGVLTEEMFEDVFRRATDALTSAATD